jgi:hypothetical protein
LARSGAFSTHQKLLQLLLIWMVPIVGAIVSLYVVRDPPSPVSGHYSTEMEWNDLWRAAHSDSSQASAPDTHSGSGSS